jgi:hypothetical protein
MSKQELPTFIKKRKLLYGTKDMSLVAGYGDTFFEAGYIDDALDFYERAKSADGLKKVEGIALKEGNLYLYRKVCRISKVEPDKKIIDDIGAKALESGKISIAAEAFRASGNEAMLKKIEEAMGKTDDSKEDR